MHLTFKMDLRKIHCEAETLVLIMLAMMRLRDVEIFGINSGQHFVIICNYTVSQKIFWHCNSNEENRLLSIKINQKSFRSASFFTFHPHFSFHQTHFQWKQEKKYVRFWQVFGLAHRLIFILKMLFFARIYLSWTWAWRWRKILEYRFMLNEIKIKIGKSKGMGEKEHAHDG